MQRRIRQRIGHELAIWRSSALPGLLVLALILVARMLGWLQFFEWTALDYLLRLRPAEATDDRILIVGIDEQDIHTVTSYPVPDRTLAQLLKTLAASRPTAIGVDLFRNLPIGDGQAELNQVFKTHANIIAIEKTLPDRYGYTISAPEGLPREQVGAADVLPDRDGNLRRIFLLVPDAQGQSQPSFSFRLAEAYLKQQQVPMGNGLHNPNALRVRNHEITWFTPDTGSYIGADDGGYQTMLNFRNSRQPFQVVSLRDILTGKVPAAQIRDRIVLVGITASSVKDIIKTTAVESSHPDLEGGVEIAGVEIHAHAVSQIISAASGRPLLNSLSEGWEYLWIVFWGLVGISLGRFIQSPIKLVLVLVLVGSIVSISCYGALHFGWWLPLVPTFLALVLNGAGLTAALFYRYQQRLEASIQAREAIIDQTFNAIHNGPLQILAGALRDVHIDESSSNLYSDLQRLNQELRTINAFMRREASLQGSQLYLSGGQEVDLQVPIHETLYEIYSSTLKRDFPCFKSIAIITPDFQAMDNRGLTLEHRRGLCRFLEEALCNVGKHAENATRLKVVCKQEQQRNVIRVTDNGIGVNLTQTEGLGTQQAQQLAHQLRCGKFRRSSTDQETLCELTWIGGRGWR
jgi:CHASE2 domain-containing sensor protein/two-component sensor histidine kinase